MKYLVFYVVKKTQCSHNAYKQTARNMLKNLDSLLLYSVKIVNKDGSQILNNLLDNYISALEKSFIADAKSKVMSLFEQDAYDFSSDFSLATEQLTLFCQVSNIITFATKVSSHRLESDEQQDLVKIMSSKVASIVVNDPSLQVIIEDVNKRISFGECVVIYKTYFDLIEKIKNKIEEVLVLKMDFFHLILCNFVLLSKKNTPCRSEFEDFLKFNSGLIKSNMLDEVTVQILELLKGIILKPEHSTWLDMMSFCTKRKEVHTTALV